MKLSSLQHCENGTAEELSYQKMQETDISPTLCPLPACLRHVCQNCQFLCSLTPSVSHAAEWLLYAAFSASESTW